MLLSGRARGALIRTIISVFSLFFAAVADSNQAADILTLQEAERIALDRDAGIASILAHGDAFRETAVAESQLPDPMLQIGTMNLPTDTFNIDQEPMTQFLTLGVRQQFPPGKSRKLRRLQLESLAEAQSYEAEDRARHVLAAVRNGWLQRFYYEGAIHLVIEQQRWFDQLADTVTAAYATGRRQQHDVLRVELELEFLKEREIELRQEALAWRGELGQWLGPAANRPLPTELPDLATVVDYPMQLTALSDHPLLHRDHSRVKAGELGESIARQQYKPAWSLDVRYGLRDGEDAMGDDRSNFFSAMISFTLPVFTGDRQDRQVAAAAAQTRGIQRTRDDHERRLRAGLDRSWAQWVKLVSLSDQYTTDVLPAARANVDAVLEAYQNDRAIFDELVRAENTLLESELKALRLDIDALTAHADLLYLSGEPK